MAMMTAEQWKKVPKWLDNPSMVFHSDTVAGRLVFIAPESVVDNPVRIIVEPKAGKLEAHVLLNVYNMETEIGDKVKHSNPFLTFAHWRDTDKLLYINKKKTSQLASRLGLLLPQRLLQPTGMSKILTEKNLAGYQKEKKLDENQTHNSRNAWLMNAFELKPTDEQGVSNDTTLPTQSLSTRQRQSLGAVGNNNVADIQRKIKQYQSVI